VFAGALAAGRGAGHQGVMSTRRPVAARPLAELVGQLVTPACRRRGIANAALIIDAAEIFGARFARSAAVERIIWPKGSRIDDVGEEVATGATLVVRADAATALALQHVAPQILERVNILIGWPAVARLKVTQAGSPPRRRQFAAPAPPSPAPPVPAAVEDRVAGVDDPELKAALCRLGASVSRRCSKGRPERP
jgi:hypothetical protein